MYISDVTYHVLGLWLMHPTYLSEVLRPYAFPDRVVHLSCAYIMYIKNVLHAGFVTVCTPILYILYIAAYHMQGVWLMHPTHLCV